MDKIKKYDEFINNPNPVSIIYNKKPSDIESELVNGVINVYTGRGNYKIISVKTNNFFKKDENIIYKVYDDRIEFTKPFLDYNSKTVKISLIHSGWLVFNITCEKLSDGTHEISDESNEDKVIVYFDE